METLKDILKKGVHYSECLVTDEFIFIKKKDQCAELFNYQGERITNDNLDSSKFLNNLMRYLIRMQRDNVVYKVSNKDADDLDDELQEAIADNPDLNAVASSVDNTIFIVMDGSYSFTSCFNDFYDITLALSILLLEKSLLFIDLYPAEELLDIIYNDDEDDDDYDEDEDEYEDEYEEDENEYEEYEENTMGNDPKRKGDIMNDLKGTLRTAYSMNKNGMINAATVTAGKALNKKACSLIDGMKGMPPAIKMITGSPFGEALVGNLIAIGLMSFTQDPRALTAANAMIQAGSFQLMENLKVEDFIESLLSGVKFNEVPAVEEAVTLDIPTPKASGKKTAQQASE